MYFLIFGSSERKGKQKNFLGKFRTLHPCPAVESGRTEWGVVEAGYTLAGVRTGDECGCSLERERWRWR